MRSTMTTTELEVLTAEDAERLTRRIEVKLGTLADAYESVMPLIREALDRRAHEALGYPNFSTYAAERFRDHLTRLDVDVRRAVVRELSDAGMSPASIAPIVGVDRSTVSRDRSQGVHDAHPEPVAKVTETTKTETFVDTLTGEVLPPPERKIAGLDGKEYTPPAPRLPRDLPKAPEPELTEEERRAAERHAADVRRWTRFAEALVTIWGMSTAADSWMAGFDEANLTDPVFRDAWTPETLKQVLENVTQMLEWSQGRVF